MGGLVEDQRRFLLRVDLPGLNAQDLSVVIDGRVLTVTCVANGGGPHGATAPSRRAPRPNGVVSRVALPANVDVTKARATYRHGVLEILLPKQGGASQRPITIAVE